MRLTYNAKQTRQPERSERGQAIILIVFSIIGLIGMTALAVDGGRVYLEQRGVQNAADNVALGAAVARVRDPQGEWVQQAYAIANNNGYDNNGATNSVMISSPPISGKYLGDIEYIQVTVFSRIDTYFGGVVGVRSSTVVGEAISRTKSPELKQLLDGNALVSLRPTSQCENVHDMSFWVHGESTLSVTGGGILINSNNPDCALMQSGSGSIRLEDEKAEIKVAGGLDVQKMYLLTPQPTLNSASIPYPPPFFMPELGCSKTATVSTDGKTISSGDWESPEPFPPPGVEHFESGVYCLKNFAPLPGSILDGSDVIFVVEGNVKLGAEIDIAISAPDTGDLAGLLFYLPSNNHKSMILNLSENSRFRGTVLAPSAEIHLNGSDSKYGFHSQFIGYSILSDGTSDIQITYADEENYDAYTMPEVQLIK